MKKLLLSLLLFVYVIVYGQVTPRNILAKKYSLKNVQQMLIAQDAYKPFPTTEKDWYNTVPDSILAKLIKNGEEALAYKFESINATVSLNYVRNGDRSEHAALSFTKRAMLKNLILAESIEDKGRFTEAIINGVWSICEESFWGVPAHLGNAGLPDVDNPIVELFSAETGTLLALTDYFVGEKLDKIHPQFRTRMYTEINKRIFVPMLTKSDGYGWMSKTKPVNNWNPWIMSNWIMTTLLLEKDKTRRSLMIHNAMMGLDLYLNGLGEEGGCDEGPSYWFAAGASVYDCLEFLKSATNGQVDVYDEVLIKKMASYIYKTHIGGEYFVNFSDADPKLIPDGLMLYRFGKAVKDDYLMQMGQWAFNKYANISDQHLHSKNDFQRPRFIQNLLTVKQIEKIATAYNPIKNVWINDVQVLTARSGNGLYVATHGGHNAESHNHNDVGDFIVYANEEPVIIDAGRGNYTARTFSAQRYQLWFTQSQYHNLPIVNGIGQLAGKEYAAKNIKSSINEKEASLSMDIAAAYDKAAGIKSWYRKVKLNSARNQIEISDNYQLNQKPASLQQVFMTICKTDISIAGKITLTTPKQLVYAVKYDPLLWTASIDMPSTDGAEYSSFKIKWDGYPIQRIILTSKDLQQSKKYLFVIEKQQ